jgi:hypothetical protein
VLPGQDAPAWAVQSLHDLYFKQGEGVGAVVAGCPKPTQVTVDSYETVAYQLGFARSGALKSVALASTRNGSTIFFGQLAEVARARLESGRAVTGSARRNTGVGDIQLLQDSTGTTAFIRIEKVKAGMDADYVVLAPPAVAAWLEAMKQTGEWLWPTSSKDVIQLVRGPGFTEVARITALSTTQSRLDLRGTITDHDGTSVQLSDLVRLGMPDESK